MLIERLQGEPASVLDWKRIDVGIHIDPLGKRVLHDGIAGWQGFPTRRRRHGGQ